MSWEKTLGMCLDHGTQLSAFALAQGALVLTNHGEFHARVCKHWEVQWKQHLVRDMMAPWLRLCRDRTELLQLLPVEQHATATCPANSDNTGNAFWLLDSQECIDRRGHNVTTRRIVILAHAQRHDVHAIYTWPATAAATAAATAEEGTACHHVDVSTGGDSQAVSIALDRAIEVLRAIHLCYVSEFLTRASRVADEVLRTTISNTHPLREALAFLAQRMHTAATAATIQIPPADMSSAGRHIWRETHMDARQRASHSILCADVRMPPANTQQTSFRLFRSHAKLSDERRARQTLRQTLEQHTRDAQLIPFIRYITTAERLRTDVAAQKLADIQAPAHAHHQLHFTQRCIIEEVLMQHLNQLRMNTYENMELRNWSDRIKALLPLTQLLSVDAQRACPYRTVGLLADLLHTLGEYQAQLAQFEPTHAAHVGSDNLFSGVARISAWVSSRNAAATNSDERKMPPLFHALIQTINATTHTLVPIHGHANTQPVITYRQEFAL
jgi:hypothetical protein